jgi:tRNA-splicing ligase RtcB (3'-phosphate/5'-hydroxy nucleic acid ligase)
MPPTRHGNVLIWASDLDPRALDQAGRTAALPFVVGQLALMADAHVGMGATIGSVVATRGAVIPSAVGVDIGCGMIAVETNLTSAALPDDLTGLHGRIRGAVPAGVGQGHDRQAVDVFEVVGRPPGTELGPRDEQRARSQYGSLGSGNHFTEVCLDERDVVWVVLHSGSRGIGNGLATRHIDIAKDLMKRWFVTLDDPDLAYVVDGTPEFDAYIADMLWAQRYAMANRDRMMDLVLAEMAASFEGFAEAGRINCHHNFCEREHHHGTDAWVTRKGAIRARAGDRGVIPGSMGTRSYIVTGLGNPASLHSSSHGAGRRMSRAAARRNLDVDGFVASMAGKAWDREAAADLIDEDPRAYKDIDVVMDDQRDLVTIDHTLSQILNYKGRDESARRRR